MAWHGSWPCAAATAATPAEPIGSNLPMSKTAQNDGCLKQEIVLEVMGRESLSRLLSHAVSMERSSGLEPWKEDNFFMDLPDKWCLSRWIRSNNSDTPLGYAVISRKSPSNVHLHRFVISETGRGVGTAAMNKILDDLKETALYITVCTGQEAYRAQRFYEVNGFRKLMELDDNILYIHSLC